PSPLECIGPDTSLPAAPAQDHRSRLAHLPRGFEDLPFGLHRARAGDRHHLRPSDRYAAGESDDRILALPFAAHLLVRLRDVDDLLDARERLEPRRVDPPVVAHEA